MFSFKKVVLMLFILFIAVNCVNAQENNTYDLTSSDNVYYVSNDGSDLNDGLSINSSFKSIEKAINSSSFGSTIYLSEGVYKGINNVNLSINSNINIIGVSPQETIIDGENLNTIFTVTQNSNLVLKNVSLINARGSFNAYYFPYMDSLSEYVLENGGGFTGGAIYNNGYLTIENCVFENNAVWNTSGEYPANAFSKCYGGAIFNNNTLYVYDSVFRNNSAGSTYQNQAQGGAIFTTGKLVINNTLFDSNTVSAFRLHLTVQDLYAYQRGAAIAGIADFAEISNCIFKNHHLDVFEEYMKTDFFRETYKYDYGSVGGAIYYDGNNWNFKNCSFLNNSADRGGSVSFRGNNTTFDGCLFLNNSASTGCGIFLLDYDLNQQYGYIYDGNRNDYSGVLINNTKFLDNFMKSYIYDDKIQFGYVGASSCYIKADNVIINNSIFHDQSVLDTLKLNLPEYLGFWLPTKLSCDGGLVRISGRSTKILNSHFEEGYSPMGGAIKDYGFDKKIVNCTFLNNHAYEGGAIYHSMGDISIENCNFINNSAYNQGGSVYSTYSYSARDYAKLISKYVNSSFINGNATYGGAIFDTGDNILFNNLTFINQTAMYGGAIYALGFNKQVHNSKFINTTSIGKDYSNGGSIYIYGDNFLFEECEFINTSCDNLGGSIYAISNNIYGINSTFTNSSAFKGGSIYISGNKGRLQSNTFINTNATLGGCIYNMADEIIISYNNIKSTNAEVAAGAIYNEGNSIILYANNITNSSAKTLANHIYTEGLISYLVVSFANNETIEIENHKNKTISADVTDNMGNPITGGFLTFLLINSNGEEIKLGESEVIEGKAYITCGNLEFGSYTLTGIYSYATAPVLTKTGTMLSFVPSKMVLTLTSKYETLSLGSILDYFIVLIDSESNNIANANISVYENGLLKKYLVTDDAGYVNSSLNEFYSFGDYNYKFIYEGDLVHGRSVVDLNFTIDYVKGSVFKEVNFTSLYPFFVTSVNTEIPFEFYIYDENGVELKDVSTKRYFSIYENGVQIEGKRLYDNLGTVYGTTLLYYQEVIYGDLMTFYKVSPEGIFLMPVSKDTPGIYDYTIEFKGGLVLTALPKNIYQNHFAEADILYSPKNVSFILVVNHENATIETGINVIGPSEINEVTFPTFKVRLSGNNTFLANKTVNFYDNGVFLGSTQTDLKGFATFTVNDYLDVGQHLFEFIYGGDEEYLASYEVIDATVYTNPDKIQTLFNNTTSLSVHGMGNNFSAILCDANGNILNDTEITVYITGNKITKKYDIVTDENASFTVPLDVGAGTVYIRCTYEGDRFFKRNSTVFNVDVDYIKTLLFGVSSIDVIGEGNYLNLVLVDENFYPLSNSTIAISFYSNEYNITFYSFTNESGVAKLKINLPVGNYYALSSFDGDLWHSNSSVLTKVDVYGDYSKLVTAANLVLREKGNYYTVKLTDSKGNPLSNENVVISVNGVPYSRMTDKNGDARLKINLEYGYYNITTYYKGSLSYKGSSIVSNLYMVMENYKLPSVLAAKSTVTYREGNNSFNVTLSDIFGNPLIGESITFFIKSKKYSAITDKNGVATLKLNLTLGDYIVTTIYDGTRQYQGNNASTKVKIVNKDANSTRFVSVPYSIFKGKGNVFSQQLLDSKDLPVVGEKVTLTVNGVSYEKKTDGNGFVYLTINLNPGSYSVYSLYEGSVNYFASEMTSEIVVIRNPSLKNAKIIGESNVSFIGKGRYQIQLVDDNNNPIAHENVSFKINDIIYNRLTNDNGYASLNINLNPGSYNLTVAFLNSADYRDANLKTIINISSTIHGNDLVKYYRNASQFVAFITDTNGNPLVNQSVGMNINGVFYYRLTDSEGRFKLNINLNPGSYILTATDPNIGLMKSFNVTVLPTVIVHDLLKVYKNDSQYEVKLLDGMGNPLANTFVEININGVFYYRMTNEKGIAVLNINLERGKYIATVRDMSNGLLMSSNVVVVNSPLLINTISTNISKGDFLQISIKEENGEVWPNEKVEIIYNDAVYSGYTADDGIISFKLNFNSGEYMVGYKEYLTNTFGNIHINVI
ncbi:MAG: hypothetical protein E7Z73_11175 [Methanobrevibacter millerae]|uniref:Adhesin-like protein n=1 Tax=Methanobrevibacter millerae TaxID=230361 RepID=A0A8T3VDS1_9EURY|nr:Ig-like domain repeat protein [Methanobrevibacter millerae]MBE6506269.1 hypothetical protein [Methanobrevibacter millerae]